MTPEPNPLGNIMVVDDNLENLKLLESVLRRQHYEVRSFPRGRLALAAAALEPPDLILLDITMPEMSGYEVCTQLKASALLAAIPVIFLSGLSSSEDKVKAFRAGGVDYIPKPFQIDEIQARVEIHLKLRRALQAERDLLERTLSGAVATIWELVQLSSPVLALRSRAVLDIVRCITRQMELPDHWQYELAATLCFVGCIALPVEVFEKAYGGEPLSRDEEQMFRAHPETAVRLLSQIPRLDVVAEIIRAQQHPAAVPSGGEVAQRGALILHLALELDRIVYQGSVSIHAAVARLRIKDVFEKRMLDVLENYSPVHEEFEVRRLPVREVHAGMVLAEDVMSKDGNFLILNGGTVLTQTWIERLENFSKVRGVQEQVRVRIPKLLGIRTSRPSTV